MTHSTEVDPKIGFSSDWDSADEPSGMFAANWNLMQSLRQTIEKELGSKLKPSDTPKNVRDFKSPTGAAKGGIHYRAGDGENLWMLMQARLAANPPGMCLMTCSCWMGPATDAPHVIFEINTTANSIFISIDCLPRRDMVEHIDYLDEVYEASGLKDVRARLDKDERFVPYVSPDPFTRLLLSPVHLLKTYKVPDDAGSGSGGNRPVVKAMKEVIQPVAEEWLRIWLKLVKERANNVPEGPAREALRRRDHWTRLNGVLRDPGTQMGKMVLGPDLGELVVQAMSGGPDRHLSAEEHKELQRGHWKAWQGVHIKYSPQGKLQETYTFVRDFKPDGTMSKVIKEGQRSKSPYQALVEDSAESVDQVGGGVQESDPDMRVYHLPGGHGAAVHLSIKEGQQFRAELSVMATDEQRTASVVPLYDLEGNLTAVLCDRETAAQEHKKGSDGWSDSSETVPERTAPIEKFKGIQQTLSPRLYLAERWGNWEGFEWEGPPSGGPRVAHDDYVLMHLPDGLSMHVPVAVKKGEGFGLSLHWQEAEDVLHQISVWYNSEGNFEVAKGGTYKVGIGKY